MATQTILQTRPLSSLTVAAVAREAKVSRQTIYTWWPTLAALAMESLLEQAEAAQTPPADEVLPEDPLVALRVFVTRAYLGVDKTTAPVMRSVMTAAQFDPEFHHEFMKRGISIRRQVCKDKIIRAVPSATDEDLDWAVDLIYGVMWYRVLIRHSPLDVDAAERVVETVIDHLT